MCACALYASASKQKEGRRSANIRASCSKSLKASIVSQGLLKASMVFQPCQHVSMWAPCQQHRTSSTPSAASSSCTSPSRSASASRSLIACTCMPSACGTVGFTHGREGMRPRPFSQKVERFFKRTNFLRSYPLCVECNITVSLRLATCLGTRQV